MGQLDSSGAFFLSAISILEIELGALQAARRDAAQATVLRTWIDDQVLPRFEGRILAVDTAVAQRCARLHVADRRDALVAATAMVHGLTIITRNVADFEPIGVVYSIRGRVTALANRSEERSQMGHVGDPSHLCESDCRRYRGDAVNKHREGPAVRRPSSYARRALALSVSLLIGCIEFTSLIAAAASATDRNGYQTAYSLAPTLEKGFQLLAGRAEHPGRAIATDAQPMREGPDRHQ